MIKRKLTMSLGKLSVILGLMMFVGIAINSITLIIYSSKIFKEQSTYSRNVIINNLKSGSLPYAIATKDVNAIATIAESQLVYDDVKGIKIYGLNNALLYESKAIDVYKGNLESVVVPIMDILDEYSVRDFAASEKSVGLIGSVELSFRPLSSNVRHFTFFTISLAVSFICLVFVVLAVYIFIRAINKETRTIIEVLTDFKKNRIVLFQRQSAISEFQEIRQQIEDTAESLVEKERTLSEAYESVKSERIKAEKAISLRDRMIRSISHDLRTPITVVKGLLGLVQDDIGRSDSKGKLTQNISLCVKSTDTLEKVVSSIFTFEEFMKNSPVCEYEAIDVFDLLQSICVPFKAKCQSKNLYFEVIKSPLSGQYVYDVDIGKFARVVNNLVENAVRYTDSGVVSVILTGVEGGVELIVRDTGPGIPDSKKEIVFDEYIQLENCEHRGDSGLGLGLSYVKRICELLGGNIVLESVIGLGTKFTVFIPFRESQLNGKDARDGQISHGLKSIVIDDHIDVGYLMQQLLIKLGIDCRTESIPEYGLKMIQDFKPDIVFVDYHMPAIDGIEFVDRLRKINTNNDLFVVAITADVHPTTIYSLNQVFDAVLTKPINERSLADIVRLCCSVKLGLSNILSTITKDDESNE